MTTSPKQYLAYHPDSMKAPYLALTDISQHMTRYKTLPRNSDPVLHLSILSQMKVQQLGYSTSPPEAGLLNKQTKKERVSLNYSAVVVRYKNSHVYIGILSKLITVVLAMLQPEAQLYSHPFRLLLESMVIKYTQQLLLIVFTRRSWKAVIIVFLIRGVWRRGSTLACVIRHMLW